MKTKLIAIFILTLSGISGHATTLIVGGKLNIGAGNMVNSPSSAVIGEDNYIIQEDNDFAALAVGYQNTMDGAYSSIVAGVYNFSSGGSNLTVGSYNSNNAVASLLVGSNHVATYSYHSYATVSGRNSATLVKPAHLVIGNGTSSTNRNNSFVVYADGDIVITKPQGDISMGIYE